MKLKPFGHEGQQLGFHFWCPGCKDSHSFYVSGSHVWGFNGDRERPTFTPSLLVRTGCRVPTNAAGEHCWCTWNAANPDDPSPFKCSVCHLFLTDGQLQFCADSEHALAGQTVPLPDWPERES